MRIITNMERWQSPAYCTGLENQRAETYRGSNPSSPPARTRAHNTYVLYARAYFKVKGYKNWFPSYWMKSISPGFGFGDLGCQRNLIKWWEEVDSIEYYYEHLGDLPGELIELMETDFIDEWEAFTQPGGNKTEKINLPEDIQSAHIFSKVILT